MAENDPNNRWNTFPSRPETQNLTADDVDRLLLSSKKIKNRTRKACYPCNRRKIKCDRDQHDPCTNCVKHSHPELCSWSADKDDESIRQSSAARRTYDQYIGFSDATPRSSSAQSPNAAALTPSATSSNENRAPKQSRSGREPTLENVVHNYRSPRNEASGNERSPFPLPSPRDPTTPGDVRHTSIASVVQGQADDASFGGGISSMLGLENNSASYLFIKASDAQERWRQLRSMLPGEKEVFKFFGFYKTVAMMFNPILIDADEFESWICKYVEDLGHETVLASRFESDKSIGSIGVLLAVLSSGTQHSDLPLQQRTKLSRDYARKSFHCLRLANFLMRPTEEIVQALLLLAQVLQNDLQALSGWTLLGTTIRLAQSLGLNVRQGGDENRTHLRFRFQKLWRAVIWQDAVLSFCLGRPPSAFHRTIIEVPISDSNMSYNDAMFCLCNIMMRIIDPLRSEHGAQAISDVEEVEAILSRTAPHLQTKDRCRTIQDRMEYNSLQIHTSFTISYICQAALRRADLDAHTAGILTTKCKQTLIASVRGFLNLSTFSIVPLRTWSYVHNALSSALLLGLMGETRTNPEVRALQEALISTLSTVDAEAEGPGTPRQKDGSSRFTNRHAKALEALQAMCVQASKVTTPASIASAEEQALVGTPSRMQLDNNGHWPTSQTEVIKSPNGTNISPGTFWDMLFADPTISADTAWDSTWQRQESWGL